jgi:hypothetical protein
MNLKGGIPVVNSRTTSGAMIGKTISAVASRLISFQAATVVSSYSASNKTLVALDVAPDDPIGALSMTGRLAQGQRVMVAFYPPRGCLVLGTIAEDLDLVVNDLSANAVSTGTLEVSGSITAPDMRFASAFDSNVTGVVSTAFTDAGTVATLTMPYPASGVVAVTVSCRLNLDNQTGAATEAGVLGFEIRDTNAGGTVRQAASDGNSAVGRSGTTIMAVSRTVVISGLPTSGTMFVRGMYRVNTAAANGEFDDVWLVVQPSP